MARASKKTKTSTRTASTRTRSRKAAHVFDDQPVIEPEEGDLPRDEVGRRKIKKQYADLLGIRIEKLKGRVLNRERINKTIEGIYFICAECKKICHNLDEGLVEDPNNEHNVCGACAKGRNKGRAA